MSCASLRVGVQAGMSISLQMGRRGNGDLMRAWCALEACSGAPSAPPAASAWYALLSSNQALPTCQAHTSHQCLAACRLCMKLQVVI